MITRSKYAAFSRLFRKKLAKITLDIPITQNELVPFYLRFGATVAQYFPEVSSEIVKLVD